MRFTTHIITGLGCTAWACISAGLIMNSRAGDIGASEALNSPTFAYITMAALVLTVGNLALLFIRVARG